MRYVEARPEVRAPVIELPRHTGGTPLKQYAVAILLTCCLGACAQPYAPPSQEAAMPPAPPQEAPPPPPPRVTSEAQIAPGRWVVDQVRCSDLLGAADEDREAAAMFYYGYLAAKAGIRVIDVNQFLGSRSRSYFRRHAGSRTRRRRHHPRRCRSCPRCPDASEIPGFCAAELEARTNAQRRSNW